MIKFLDFLLLFILSFFYTQGYLIVQASTFERNLFPLLFFLLIGYGLLSIQKAYFTNNSKWINRWKLIIFSLICLITVGKTFYNAVNLRHQMGNSYPVYDNVIQLEEGVKYILQGKNPYSETYVGTPLEPWFSSKELSVSLYHFVTLPFYVLFSAVASIPANLLFGFFDERMVHLISLITCVFLIAKLIKNTEKKIIALTLFIFNPAFIHYFLEGRNDIFVFSLLFVSLYFLHTKRFLWSALFFGLGFVSKQSSWLMLPFYFYYIYLTVKPRESFKSKFFPLTKLDSTFSRVSNKVTVKNFNSKYTSIILNVISKTWPFFVVTVALFMPFIVWDFRSFFQDIYLYPGGGLPTSYPISGIGASMLFLRLGLIASPQAYFPFWILQILFAIPLLSILLLWLKKKPSISLLTLGYSLFLFTYWIFSRFVMESYIGFVSILILIGIIFYQVENEKNFIES